MCIRDRLDSFLLGHPEAIFGAPVEATVLDPSNRHVLAPHLAAAAAPPLLVRWLALALPFIRHRLRLALRAPADEPEALLDCLSLPAALHLSRMHVDLVVPLERVALPARRAGLDRDPGWLPLFGRIITFHFE